MRSNGPSGGRARLRQQHAGATRRAILAAARHAFAQGGYAATSLDEICGAAGLTKGALYHHFKDKAAVLEAVYVEMEQELAAQVGQAVESSGGGAWERMLAAMDAFFTASAEPAYVRIVLRDAPLVLAAHHGREIDHAIGLELVAALVSEMLGEARRGFPAHVTARILLAAASEVAMAMAHAADPEAVRRDGTAVLIAMLEGLVGGAARPRRR